MKTNDIIKKLSETKEFKELIESITKEKEQKGYQKDTIGYAWDDDNPEARYIRHYSNYKNGKHYCFNDGYKKCYNYFYCEPWNHFEPIQNSKFGIKLWIAMDDSGLVYIHISKPENKDIDGQWGSYDACLLNVTTLKQDWPESLKHEPMEIEI